MVSTRLRPWVELDLSLSDILFAEEEAVLRFRIAVTNSGTAAARDIVVEALALNAGEQQAQELATFFERAAASDRGLAELARGAATELSHEVRLPRSAIREYEVQGRRVFVPILAFNATYRWGSGLGRTSCAFLLGHERGGSDRLAPLAVPAGTSRLVGIGVRRLEETVRR